MSVAACHRKKREKVCIHIRSLISVFFLSLFIIISATSTHGIETGQAPSAGNISGYKTKHVFIVVMDGVRYSETFGDSTHALIPRLYNDLRPEGTLFTNFYKGVLPSPGRDTARSYPGPGRRYPMGVPSLHAPRFLSTTVMRKARLRRSAGLFSEKADMPLNLTVPIPPTEAGMPVSI